MKIGVNARFLSKPFTGIGQYTKNLFKELALIDEKNEYILVVNEKIEEPKDLPVNIKIYFIPEKKIGTAGMKKTWWEQIQVPEFFKKEHVDIAFFPYPSNPWTSDWYGTGIKTFVTVHDCIPWTNKNYRKGILSKMYHSQSRKAVSKTDIVLTVSEASKKEIINVCEVPEKKIKVIYNDASEVYKKRLSEDFIDKGFARSACSRFWVGNPSGRLDVLKKFNLKKNEFFLYVGGYDERKNVKYLVEEYEKFAKKYPGFKLVLAGGKSLQDQLYLSYEIDDENVIKTGFVPEEELAALYKNCAAFVNFSKQEGFNIPVIEAANCSAPLVLSDIPVHKEVACDAAIFVDVEKQNSAFKAFEKITEKDVSEDLRKKSFELAKKYSWKVSVQKLKNYLV